MNWFTGEITRLSSGRLDDDNFPPFATTGAFGIDSSFWGLLRISLAGETRGEADLAFEKLERRPYEWPLPDFATLSWDGRESLRSHWLDLLGLLRSRWFWLLESLRSDWLLDFESFLWHWPIVLGSCIVMLIDGCWLTLWGVSIVFSWIELGAYKKSNNMVNLQKF